MYIRGIKNTRTTSGEKKRGVGGLAGAGAAGGAGCRGFQLAYHE